MFSSVYHALGPVFWPMVLSWVVTVYIGVDLFWQQAFGGGAGCLDAGAAKLKRIGNSAMIVGLFGQVYAVTRSLSSLSGGATAINDLIQLLGVSLWSTLAGISVALLAEAIIMLMLWFPGVKEDKNTQALVPSKEGEKV